ncbi:MAG: phosphohydrolase [gamma proteobacterium symbiont of Ctena orbiculata]|uniref:HDOD domain-containing protein n=1 Tax=Candidatus Thiodiazotropha taylori TaxID=2792791 RepID=A0A944M7F7_9GAMM|nr:HDOD domain-containing protein [Candidatus Thiodiazotropha taylori]PUB89355.1 MAG: phosphohydrolase [gamma proteobacterium symbiont of Ctena orbiculata]MBT2987654.1 HDOD domain-containing protein [Candidatus Thiodiazotropha taylori]MBT2995091.1 HDOD domain-containing protein [Candidatus Thiodiazotropha taylori]MBT2999990.1 HDOD domain-containing protein [Candidatus Thiodiazotropha taylori]
MDPKTLVKDLDHLVSLPDICIKVNRLMATGNYSSAQVADIIIQDTDISARLLRLVNSSFYGLPTKVETLSRAVTIIGADELRNLVMAATALRTFTGIPKQLVDMTEYWQHSVTTGVMAQSLAKHCNILHSERLFVMGLLHDVGRLVIYLTLPEKATDILYITGGDNWILPETETDVLGFTHLDVGAELMRAWELPESFVAVAGCHNNPQQAGDYRLETSLVHIAKAIANGEMVGLSVEEMLWAITPFAWTMTGLTPEMVTPLIDEMVSKSHDALSMITSHHKQASA